ncbi:GtrA family protein [Streptomyces sp. NTH33]|uniref:GtrA family protein n=1 Tax=Streptomyces sp. NTH33 TaxID=1735453 RepID=UPI0015E8B42B|nr:GtrA family protein [Streptomyces sp. NTH33]
MTGGRKAEGMAGRTGPEHPLAREPGPPAVPRPPPTRRWRRVLPEVTRFAVSGAAAYLTEVGTFNLFLVLGLGAALSSLSSAAAGTVVAYVGNRYWTYRGRPFGRDGRRIALFCAVNVLGAGITTGCVVVSHDVFGLHGAVAANVARNAVGMALAMVFRFWAYRTWVFPARPGEEAGLPAVRGGSGPRAGAGTWPAAFGAAAPPWLAAHALVAVALGLAWCAQGHLPETGAVRPSSGLLVWDSAWYRSLALHGYGPPTSASVRFFPLLPLAVRVAAALTRLPATAALLVLCSACALVYGAVLHVLTREETAEDPVARRTVWLSQLAPGCAVLVLGYTEAVAGMLTVLFFLGLGRGRGSIAVCAGALSGLVRPTGVLLALPALVEVVRARSRARRVRAALAALPPVAGTSVYLAWCAATGRGWLAPYRVQTGASLRGAVVGNPLADWFHPNGGRLTPSSFANLIVAVALLAVAVGLLWVAGRRLPVSWTVWALAMVAAAASATGWRSLPRYLGAVFPLLVAAAVVLRTRRRWYPALAACGALFTALATSSFGGQYIP